MHTGVSEVITNNDVKASKVYLYMISHDCRYPICLIYDMVYLYGYEYLVCLNELKLCFSFISASKYFLKSRFHYGSKTKPALLINHRTNQIKIIFQ